ncbi:hypothetical protein BDA99DRAFT_280215 [Phascolomyces articulosus]|uniref:Uncharacterized protein n=1 Tax=Phascolomyces articulosus TaxID=60185 RepID=A0AAD5PI48_9FUNG|nr:hypothetical protein BDA99DRAFT_280215 [Phascolomyces articulosus]
MPSVGSASTLPPQPPPTSTKGIYNVLMTNGNATMNASNGSSAFLSGSSGEEISTIFVVGFPDDMQEREFQNMFIFSPGFEAATLKIPSKDQEDDMTSPSAPASSNNNNNSTNNNNNNNNNTNGRKQIVSI